MSFQQELDKRNKALLEMDMLYARPAMPGTTDEVREIAMHKARYECTQLPREARHASGEWLRNRHLCRMTGDALLPEGELPDAS
ncbi:MAG: hypothetical protein QJR02_11445 [Sinobacteraceae bacterium]|nr:hypothetical protein [Nevskiaceae bacterium]